MTNSRHLDSYELRQWQKRFSALAETAQEGIAEFCIGFRISFVSTRFAEMLGYLPQELLDTSFLNLISESDRNEFTSGLEHPSEGPVRREVTLRRHDGGTLMVMISTGRTGEQDSALTKFVAMVTDLSERKASEDEIGRLNSRVHKLSGDLLRLRDSEDRYLARQLHDNAGQLLAGLSMNLALLDKAAGPLEHIRSLIRDIASLAEECSGEIRRMSYLLHPPLLDELGLLPALKNHVSDFTRRTGSPVDLCVSPDFGRLSEEAEIALFRAVQEGLAGPGNIPKSGTAVIRLHNDGIIVTLELERNFTPTDPASAEPSDAFGTGVSFLQLRATQLRGSLEVDYGADCHRMVFRFPVKSATARNEAISNTDRR